MSATTPTDLDLSRMQALVAFTAQSLSTASPIPFGAAIYHSATGEQLLSALNQVRVETDPSSHAEVCAIRLAAQQLGSISLAGYTLYTTCEPCPMCMATVLWAGLDRVVYGATIEDASRHCRQIYIAAEEVSRRSDMPCEVVGPVLRDECYALFTHPAMLAAFATWPTAKRSNSQS